MGPISSRGTTPDGGVPTAPPSGEAAVENGKLQFDLPKAWNSETPGSSMRLAQASIPGAAGAGELGVFYFGAGQGGSIDANLQRWTDQMEAGPGTPKPERGTLESHGLKVTWVDVHGTLNRRDGDGALQPGDRRPPARGGRQGPGGPWFFKATGPDKTLAPQRDAFFTMLKSVRTAPNA